MNQEKENKTDAALAAAIIHSEYFKSRIQKTNTFPLWRGTKGEEKSKPTKNYTEIANFLVNIKNGK